MRKLVPTALGIYLAASGAAGGQEGPAPVSVANEALPLQAVSVDQQPADQQLAAVIAQRMRSNAALKKYRVDVSVTRGAVVLAGQVADQAQRDEVVRTVAAIPGVASVRDRLSTADGSVVQPVEPLDQVERMDVTQPVQAAAPPPPPLPVAPGGGMPPEPLPIYTAVPGGMTNGHMQPPPLPPYAWPTYAPYNNYSRVAYPKEYPYESWPFIGPMYPFPKVPLGWRAVTLRWQDGYWWYSREASGHDWWRIRYW